MSIVIVLIAIMKLTHAIKPTAIVMQTTIIKLTVIVMTMTIIKAAAGMRTLTQRYNSYSRMHRRASADDRINVTFPEEFGSISKERYWYRKAMEAGKEERKGSFASVVMIAAIAVLIVLIGLKAGAGMSGTIDKKETLPAMSTEEDLIPVEKISGEWYTDK